MTGTEFEKKVCDLLASKGLWVHNFAKAKNGSQPFDILAIGESCIYAYDCKVISNDVKTLTQARIEDNQIFSFTRLYECCVPTQCGFLVWKNGVIYYIAFYEITGEKSVKLEGHEWMWQLEQKSE